MRSCQFIEKFVAFFVLLAFFFPSYVSFSTISVQGAEGQEHLYVFFVQNQEYDKKDKKLTGNVKYNESVDKLYEALTRHTNDCVIKRCKDSEDVKGDFEKWLNDLKSEWNKKIKEDETLPLDRFSSSTTFLIVLNGHGAQLDSEYVFMNTKDKTKYEPLKGFLTVYKRIVAPSQALKEKQKAKFVFWVLTCRTDLKNDNGVSKYDNVALKDFNCEVLYACEEGGLVDVGKNVKSIPILDALTEGVAGAADAEGNYDGNVSFEEIHTYAREQNKLRMSKSEGDVGKSRAEIEKTYPNDARNPPSDTILSWIDSRFYTPYRNPADYRKNRIGEYFEGRADGTLVEEYDDVVFPSELPAKKYRYDYLFRDVDFMSGNYSKAYFRGLDLTNAKFSSGKLKGAYFDHCILTGATCGGKPIANVDTQKKERFTVER